MSKKKFIIYILIILLILIKAQLFSSKYKTDDFVKKYTVFVEDLKYQSEIKVSYNVKLLGTNDKFVLNIYDNSYDNIQTDLTIYSNYKYGDVLEIEGKISIPKKLNNPGEFDYKKYLYSNNIHGLINTYVIPKKIEYSKNNIESIYSQVYAFKDYIQNLILNSMEEKYANLAISMIYGDTTNLEENVKEDFKNIGISHLMSVSGTHITSFMIIINIFFRINKKKDKATKNKIKNKLKTNIAKIVKCIIQIICICLYTIFTGFGVSVLRAGIMLIISIICDMVDKRKNKYKALAITVGIILLNSPYAIFNVGMQLSFLATLGIITFGNHFAKILHSLTNKIKNEYINKVVSYLLDNIAITIAVQLMIMPIQIDSFNKLPFPVIIPNLILGIISTPIRVIGTIGIIISFLPKVAIYIFRIVEIFVKLLYHFTQIFKMISFGITTVSMPAIFFVIYYIFVIGIFVHFKIKNILKRITQKNEKNSLRKLLKYLKSFEIIIGILIILLVIYFNIYSIYLSEYVYFFNVEQGDMSYIKCGTSSVLVDIGSMRDGLAFNTISNYFKSNNLNRIDFVIISHMHKDHMNGLEMLLQNYKVGEVICSKPKIVNKTYEDFKRMIGKYNIKLREVRSKDEINIGKIKINILLPSEKYIDSDDEVNANSLICKISINEKYLLYMGDASIETEEKLIKEKLEISNIYILKVGHHGSKTATSDKFIKKTKAQNAVISALKKYYGHPHEDTINTLKENNVYIYLTEKIGAIKFNLS